MRSATGTGSSALGGSKRITAASATGKLNGQAFTHKVGAMEGRNDIAGIHRILILNETEAVHELDLGDLSGAMSVEVALDICLGCIARKIAQIEPCRGNFGHVDGDESALLEVDVLIATNTRCVMLYLSPDAI